MDENELTRRRRVWIERRLRQRSLSFPRPTKLSPDQLQVLRKQLPKRRTLWWRFTRARGMIADAGFWTIRQVDAANAMLRKTPGLIPMFRLLGALGPAKLPTRYAESAAPWREGADLRAHRPHPEGESTAEAALPVVVVLAGLATPWGFMRPMLDALTERGFRTVVLPQLGWNYRSVAELAELVDLYLRAHPEYGRVLLVGHSKGGLIAKQVLLRDADSERTLGAVAISAPFRGAVTAKYVFGSSWNITREIIGLRPGTPTQLALTEHDSVDQRMVSIIPLYDPIVGVPGTLVQGKNRTVRALGHNRLLGDPRVHELVARELRRLAACAVDEGTFEH
ncbi:esterase/lipase family protein [Gulosibacter bifidus]|uniref:Esterase/lipase family protein n=1 Tax=Gulosibacter bifidus TaxID=272239 RepID=A0ABW5RKN6_9MICO|nr:alpha/beta hydrolase [Gulosibacter bifidus]